MFKVKTGFAPIIMNGIFEADNRNYNLRRRKSLK